MQNLSICKLDYSYWKYFLILPLLVFLFSCERESTTITKGMKKNFPNRSLIDANIVFRDSGRVSLNLRAPLIEEYSLIDSPYTIFKKGVEVDFFDKGSTKPGFFKADWGRLSDATGIYEGRGNVLIISENGDTVKTDQLFWDKNRKLIYTTKLVELIGKDGSRITARNGLESTDDLEEYTLFNNEGYLLMDDNTKF